MVFLKEEMKQNLSCKQVRMEKKIQPFAFFFWWRNHIQQHIEI